MPDRRDACFTTIAHRDGVVHAIVCPEFAARAATGHFPDEPLLPGSTLLAVMSEAARLLHDPARRLVSADRALFRRRVRPTDAIEVIARLDGEAHVHTDVRTGDGVAASGRLRFEPPR